MPGPQHSSLRAQLAAHQWQLVPPHRLRPVQRPCARIVEAGLLARQQVERDLHDGAQQRLLAVAATLARTELVATDEERVAVITDARQQLSQALSELRSLALGIHPVLTQGGLAAALRSLADRAAISVDLNIAADLRTRRLSATAEATLWFVASEAIANAVKYSNASRITLTLATANEQLQLTVADNGRGGAQLRRGGGLAGLAKRVGALGGAFSVNSLTDGGTRVEAVLPCAF
jgi:signal transduction histidine kinase